MLHEVIYYFSTLLHPYQLFTLFIIVKASAVYLQQVTTTCICDSQ